tara:strand:- start:2521 stop:3894 length:1374 start_codon:yes stop_codon:yes gene_type:complete
MEGLGINFRHKGTAIIDGDKKVNYIQLKKNVLKTISFLRKKKIVKNSKILVSIDNSIEFVYLYLASIINNSIIIPINKRDYQVSKKNIIKYLSPDLIIDKNNILEEIYKNKEYKIKKKFNPDNVFSIFFSSGTEGEAKGIAHSYLSLKLSAKIFIEHNNLNNNTRFLQFLPLSYMAGFLNSILCILLVNGKIVINKEFDFKFLLNFPNLINKFKINTIWLTPSNLLLINEMYGDKKIFIKIKTLKKIFVGTAPLVQKDKNKFEKKFKKKLFNSYGLSEVLFISCANNKKNAGVGQILKNQIIKINKRKEILVKNNTFLKFYYKKNKKIIPKLVNNYFNTGDLGYLDKNKNLHIIGRSKDIIIKGGENIYPSNIENITSNKKLIEEICVFGFKDNINGEEIGAAVIKKPKISNITIIKHFKKKLTSFNFPKKIFFVKKLPKSINGKILKIKLKKSLSL